jgi:hypothetical protein
MVLEWKFCENGVLEASAACNWLPKLSESLISEARDERMFED